jgi:hypothetical protein
MIFLWIEFLEFTLQFLIQIISYVVSKILKEYQIL